MKMCQFQLFRRTHVLKFLFTLLQQSSIHNVLFLPIPPSPFFSAAVVLLGWNHNWLAHHFELLEIHRCAPWFPVQLKAQQLGPHDFFFFSRTLATTTQHLSLEEGQRRPREVSPADRRILQGGETLHHSHDDTCNGGIHYIDLITVNEVISELCCWKLRADDLIMRNYQ